MPFVCNHLKDAGQTYLDHLADAFLLGAHSCLAGAVFFVHGVCPWWFERTGSRIAADVLIRVKEKERQCAMRSPIVSVHPDCSLVNRGQIKHMINRFEQK